MHTLRFLVFFIDFVIKYILLNFLLYIFIYYFETSFRLSIPLIKYVNFFWVKPININFPQMVNSFFNSSIFSEEKN